MGALFDEAQDCGGGTDETEPMTFKDYAAADLGGVFFREGEHADWHLVDGKRALVILEESDIRKHSAHWEAGAKQNFDTGLYTAHAILFIRAEDYGPKPKQDKVLVMDNKRTYLIKKCGEESGVYRMTLERTRQG